MDIETRIERYWNERSANFGEVRRRELESADAEAWREFITTKIPARRPLKILDVGTGAGFFAILLSRLGHEVIGIDMSREMLTQARLNAEHFAIRAEFSEMNAQKPDFDDEMFDVVISRNLTWTLPDVESAYREWRRVLKCGGVLLNFDSDYGDANFFNVTTCSGSGVNATNAARSKTHCRSAKNGVPSGMPPSCVRSVLTCGLTTTFRRSCTSTKLSTSIGLRCLQSLQSSLNRATSTNSPFPSH